MAMANELAITYDTIEYRELTAWVGLICIVRPSIRRAHSYIGS